LARTRRREEAVVRLLASVTSEPAPDSPPTDPRDINPYSPRHTPRRSPQIVCTICQDQYEVGDSVVTLVCGHSFHRQCLDMWTPTQMASTISPRCACCRSVQEARSYSDYVEEPRFETPSSVAGELAELTMPWWPASLHACYHLDAHLQDGRLSLLIDPGALTNLMGEKLARALSARAIQKATVPAKIAWPPH